MNDNFMRMAIDKAKENINSGEGGPFGACIVKDSKLVAVARNTVLKDDATCHAEINAIRQASRKLGTYDLSGCVIYSTTEPCPMCFSAIHWAKIDTIIYGTSICDVKKLGFNELSISNEKMKALGGSPVTVHEGFLREECVNLLEDWHKQSGGQTY